MPDRATMPDERSGPDYIQLDALADSINEDPGRWLDGHLDPVPRIRGLASIERVRGWTAAERKIARIRNREPRENLITLLELRESFLEEYEPETDFQRDTPKKTVLERTRDGEVVPYGEVDRSDALEGLGNQAVVTDGGESGGS